MQNYNSSILRVPKRNIVFWLLITYSILIPLSRKMVASSTVTNLLLSFVADVILIGIFIIMLDSKLVKRLTVPDLLVVVFIIISLFSVLNAMVINIGEVNLFIYGVHMTLLPIIVYFAARYTTISLTYLLSMIYTIGIVHVIIALVSYQPIIQYMPGYMGSWLSNFSNLITYSIQDNWGLLVRARTVLDSLSFGNIAAITSILATYFVLTEGKTKYYVGLFLSISALILSYQRGAWIGALVGLLLCILLVNAQRKGKAIMGITILLVIALISVRYLLPNEYLSYLLYRWNDVFTGGSQAFQRTDQWEHAFLLISQYPFGIGLGTLGHKAVGLTSVGIYDGNYFKLLAEIGLLGLGVFLALIGWIIIRYVTQLNSSRRSEISVLFCILLVYILQGVGTNVWDLYYINVVFWIVLGSYVKLLLYEPVLKKEPNGIQFER